MSLSPPFHVVSACRICESSDLHRFLSLGSTPLANAFVAPENALAHEARYPLDVFRCGTCGLVQLGVVVDPRLMFSRYVYATSASQPTVEHFQRYAEMIVGRFDLARSLVVEVGSNDGVLLRSLARFGAQPLGVEPAGNLADAATAEGLETLPAFFDLDVAQRIADERGPARAVVANNVLAHVDDVRGVIAAVDALLAPDGVFIAEFPYLADLLEHVEYDTIYHEHLSYFSVAPLLRLFAEGDLELFDVWREDVHGGSLRIFAGRRGRHRPTSALLTAHETERRLGVDEPEAYMRFAKRVVASRSALRVLLARLHAEGRRVAAIGASAKGNTLLSYCGLGSRDLAFVADSTPAKQGLLTPGTHIPVVAEDAICRERPDYTLLLAWNYADAIVAKFADYVASGGRFIHPIPLARLLP